ncbi:leucine-rich repeat domain-containing protein [Pedobacter antarcticus]|uniref:leucine-rich repeat domain-containing protein n=1 Tax=Pedobacter antarcticus TaxID=34086 RepID=UPI00088C8EC1|nr:leucine-rich repeat domain-containing protein [Pedobacter antarcticus]SDL54576.1 Leucine rich repeat-containing protein [Pedobacter antarcticus]
MTTSALLLQITSAGYLFLIISLLSIGLAKLWLVKKKKSGNGILFLVSILIWFALMLPGMISLTFFENGNTLIRAAITLFWVLAAGLGWLYSRSKRTFSAISVMMSLFVGIGFLMLLGMMGGMGYFIYLRIFTHEKDDAPVWAVFLCIFFLAVLLLILLGKLFEGKSRKIDKTEYNNLQEALQFPELVFNLDLSGQNLRSFPTQIFNFPNLAELDLSNNQFTTLPTEIGKMKKLSKIRLTNNPLTDQERANLRRSLPQELELIFRN